MSIDKSFINVKLSKFTFNGLVSTLNVCLVSTLNVCLISTLKVCLKK